MNSGDKLEITIDKLGNLGKGLAKYEGIVIMTDNVCPKDKVLVEITKIKKHYAEGKVLEITTPSPYRVKPFCPMQKVCGACQMQFIDYDYQLEIKRQIVKDTLHNIGNIDIEVPLPVKSPQIKNYRHKIQYPVAQTKNSKRIIAGYYKPSTHEIVNIKYCPIQPQICDKIIEFIKENAPKYGISGYDEKKHSGLLRHIVIRNSAYNNENLVVLVINSDKIPVSHKLKDFSNLICEKFQEICGVCVNFNPQKSNIILGKNTECLAGKNYIEEKLLDKTFEIGAETFFQVNPKSAENIFKYVKNYIQSNFNNPTVLDAYAGISAFGICVSDICNKVVTIEENDKSVKLAKDCLKLNKVSNVEIHSGDAADFLRNETRKFDAVILDPPRKGCSELSLDEAYRLSKGVILYVSCNPATLARDLKYLINKGAKIKSIQPFDMFCHTYHIENVAIIEV